MNTCPSNKHHQKNRFAIKFGNSKLFIRQIYSFWFQITVFFIKISK